MHPYSFIHSLLRLTVVAVDAEAAAAADADRLRCLLCRPGQHGHTK